MTHRARWICALLLTAACRPAASTSVAPTQSAADVSRDVTRPDLEPPMYRPGSEGPRVAITRNAYGAYRWAPKAPQLGDTMEDFELPDARGGTWSLREARAKGPVIVVFYRGFW